MKRALAILAVASMFGFAGLAQGTLTGQWDFDFTLGMRDVVITDPGATITIEGGTYAVSQGLVTIPDKTVTITVAGQNIPLTVPGGTYICNGSVTVSGGTFNVTAGQVTIPDRTVTVHVAGQDIPVTIPGQTFTIGDNIGPFVVRNSSTSTYEVSSSGTVDVDITGTALFADLDGTQKSCDFEYIHTFNAVDPALDAEMGGLHNYYLEVIDDPHGAGVQTDSGTTTVPYVTASMGSFDWCSLEFSGGTLSWDFNRDIQVPVGSGLFETLTFRFHGSKALTHQDYVDGVTLTLESSEDPNGNPTRDSLDRLWKATITVPVVFNLTDAKLVIPAGTELGTCTYDGKELTFILGSDVEFTVDMPASWPFDQGTYGPGNCAPRPTVTVNLDEAQGWVSKSESLTIPDQTVTVSVNGQDVQVTIPGGTYDVSGQTVTIPDQTITFSGQVTIPDYTTTIVVDGQEIEVTIPGGTYEVSDQTVTIPDKTITIPGWSQTIEKLPDFGFKTSLKLVYTIAGWEFTSVSKFEDATFSDQSFEVSGNIGAASVTGKMSFDPSTPAYKSSWVKAALDFAGVSFTMKVAHDPDKMVYTLTASSDPLSATVAFQDDCTGIYFKDAKVSLKGISFCCDVTYDVETSFSKANGFEYLKFTAKNLFPICCGISFDMLVKFTTDMKEVSITPKLAEIGDACFTLYADLDWSNNAIGGLEVYGWKIRCDLAECNYIEFLTALDPSYKAFKDIFKGDEFQYAKLGFCGPGCCGGNYKVDVAIYFDNGGGLFGVSRLGANLEIPVMSNFTARASFSTMEPVLGFGWTFKF